jgi:hypothetical protein
MMQVWIHLVMTILLDMAFSKSSHFTDGINRRAKLAPVDWADRSSICFSQLDDRDMFKTDSTDWSGFYKELKQLPKYPKKKKTRLHQCLAYIDRIVPVRVTRAY